MRRMFALCPAFLLFAALACADEQHDHKLSAQEIGSIHFSTSCAKNMEATFNRAVAFSIPFSTNNPVKSLWKFLSAIPNASWLNGELL